MRFTNYSENYDSNHEAAAAAIAEGYSINKYADPVEGARESLSVDEAEEVASEDPGLLYLVK